MDPPGDPVPVDISSDDVDALEKAARQWILETGRTCGDFFPTLRKGPTADRLLAGRATLLTKVKSMSNISARVLSDTVCARITFQRAKPPAAPVPPVPAGVCEPVKLIGTDFNANSRVVASGLSYWAAVAQRDILNSRRRLPSDEAFSVIDCSGRRVN